MPEEKEKNTALQITSESGQLLSMAIDKGLDIQKLQMLMDLRDRDELRKAEKEFEKHFAEMQKDYKPAYKKKDVLTESGKHAYSYCPLPSILSVYAPILARHGFSYRWEENEVVGSKEKITTCFLSGYGFSRKASISLPYGETNKLINQTQARGATSEYGRRYTFMNVTGCIVADDTDNDGIIEPQEQPNQESKPAPKPAAPTQAAQSAQPQRDNLSEAAYAEIFDILVKMNLPENIIDARLKWAKTQTEAYVLKIVREQYRDFFKKKGVA